MDPAWSETGDRYMLKLFRDHVFHQVTEDGRPYLDMAHVVHSLNKLDAGTNEKVISLLNIYTFLIFSILLIRGNLTDDLKNNIGAFGGL